MQFLINASWRVKSSNIGMCDILHKGKGHFKNKTEQIAASDASMSIKQAFFFSPYALLLCFSSLSLMSFFGAERLFFHK